MNIDELLMREKARRDAYKYLAACYYLPNGELTTMLKGLEHQLGVLGFGALSYATLMRNEFESLKDLEELKIDFARLFVGPYSLLAPPYGSIYLERERKIMGNSTLYLLETYRNAGVDLSDNFRDAPDHIAAELEFMYFLVFKEVEALENSDIERTFGFLEKQRAFLRQHLGAWVFDFADSLEKNAETGFYKSLAGATKAFMKEELDYLEEFHLAQAS
jgi:TorA maturation chaperone TorD